MQLLGGRANLDGHLDRDAAARTTDANYGMGTAVAPSSAHASQEEAALSTRGTEDVLSDMGDDPETPRKSPSPGPPGGDEGSELLPA